MSNYDHIELMNHLEGLKSCALITTGRTGSDFLQSLFDSHTEVLTFNGIFWFHDFWNSSKCNKIQPIIIDDLLDEFIGCHIEKLKSRYDYQEQKDCMGKDGNQSISIDFLLFKLTVIELLVNREINSRSFMLSIYGAYAICLGQDLNKKHVIFHHIHHVHRLPQYLSDFPESKIISMTRDPRANFVSGIMHHRKYNPSTDNEGHLYFYIKRIIVDSDALNKFNNKSVVVKIEDLGEKCVLKSLCKWLGVEYENTLQSSTFGGLQWKGDRLSSNKNKESGWSAKMLENSWETKLSFLDKYLLNTLLNDRLIHYGYKNKPVHIYDYLFCMFVVLVPLRFELRFFSYKYIKIFLKEKNYKGLIYNFVSYSLRVLYFYKVLFKKMFGSRFFSDYISCR